MARLPKELVRDFVREGNFKSIKDIRFDPLILGLISLFCAFYDATLNSSDSFPLYFS
jgi:hypothetical protein